MLGVTKIHAYQTEYFERELKETKKILFGTHALDQHKDIDVYDEIDLRKPAVSPSKLLYKSIKGRKDIHLLSDEEPVEALRKLIQNEAPLGFGELTVENMEDYFNSGDSWKMVERNIDPATDKHDRGSVNSSELDEFLPRIEAINIDDVNIEEQTVCTRYPQLSPSKLVTLRTVSNNDNLPILSPKRRRSADSENRERGNLSKKRIITPEIEMETMREHETANILDIQVESVGEQETTNIPEIGAEMTREQEPRNLLTGLQPLQGVIKLPVIPRRKKIMDEKKELPGEFIKKLLADVQVHTQPRNNLPSVHMPLKNLMALPATFTVFGRDGKLLRERKWAKPLYNLYKDNITAPLLLNAFIEPEVSSPIRFGVSYNKTADVDHPSHFPIESALLENTSNISRGVNISNPIEPIANASEPIQEETSTIDAGQLALIPEEMSIEDQINSRSNWVKADVLAKVRELWRKNEYYTEHENLNVTKLSDVIPESETNRIDAARCFEYLLELNAENLVELVQNHPYEDIFIRPDINGP
ncbi:uncharacterized protein [Prorops nasuta]|uniref:uncharacterized protein n=1 Tax=Prorops nasuta TaxID=863751 RepID=UPI0034CF4099